MPYITAQEKSVSHLKKYGWHVVIWEVEFVAMAKGQFGRAEVYPDGTIKYV